MKMEKVDFESLSPETQGKMVTASLVYGAVDLIVGAAMSITIMVVSASIINKSMETRRCKKKRTENMDKLD